MTIQGFVTPRNHKVVTQVISERGSLERRDVYKTSSPNLNRQKQFFMCTERDPGGSLIDVNK